jgi:hypothetical protein
MATQNIFTFKRSFATLEQSMSIRRGNLVNRRVRVHALLVLAEQQIKTFYQNVHWFVARHYWVNKFVSFTQK